MRAGSGTSQKGQCHFHLGKQKKKGRKKWCLRDTHPGIIDVSIGKREGERVENF